FTYIKLENGTFVYVCIILDAFDLSVVSFKVSHFIDANLAKDTLEIAAVVYMLNFWKDKK
ncbi:MAG: hypothetical protein ACRC0V_12160, partial [Fusobacteriaceae bacterium]